MLFLKKLFFIAKARLTGTEIPPHVFVKKKFDPRHPNIYVHMLDEYAGWIYTEKECLAQKGSWKSVFAEPSLPLDLEIGCGNGYFFENIVKNNPQRNYLGIELKYKPLVQTIRRVKKLGLQNGKGIRFHANYVDRIFSPGEIENTYIYFPDPWPKARHAKNRLMKAGFLNKLFEIQKPGAFLDFKTDSEPYFDWAMEEFKKTPYRQVRYSKDLHKSEWATSNFVTAFEKIFISKGQPIFYARFERRR